MRLLACLALLLLLWVPGTGHAARTFDGSTQYLSLASALVTAPSFSICGWFRPAAPAGDATIMAIANNTLADHFFVLNTRGVATPTLRARTNSGTLGTATTTASWTDAVWNHGCGTWGPGVTARSVYVNGGNVGTNATSSTPSTPNVTDIGRLPTSSPSSLWDGDLANICVWTVVLTAAEVAGLASGGRCSGVRPDALIARVPLWGAASPEPDLAAGRTWALTGPPPAVASGPPMGRRR